MRVNENIFHFLWALSIILLAIFDVQGFYVRTGNDQVKQHHDYMPQNSVLLRDMPATFGATHLIELFQTLVLEDGSPCPLPNPEKIRSDGTTWYDLRYFSFFFGILIL